VTLSTRRPPASRHQRGSVIPNQIGQTNIGRQYMKTGTSVVADHFGLIPRSTHISTQPRKHLMVVGPSGACTFGDLLFDAPSVTVVSHAHSTFHVYRNPQRVRFHGADRHTLVRGRLAWDGSRDLQSSPCCGRVQLRRSHVPVRSRRYARTWHDGFAGIRYRGSDAASSATQAHRSIEAWPSRLDADADERNGVYWGIL
jgi:hypothetical protein